MKKIVILSLMAMLVYSCGDPSVDISSVEYGRDIVIEGYVYPGEPVRNIWIMRNIPLNTQVEADDLYLTPNVNQVRATINGVALQYDPAKKNYYTNDLQIDFNTEYRLIVEAVIDDETFHSEITTKTPTAGFDVINNDLGDLVYRDQQAYVDFHPSEGTDFYAFSINALDASFDTFISNNPYFPNIDSVDLADNFKGFKYQFNLLLNIAGNPSDTIRYQILGLDTWFYGNYDVIVYAGDKNMKDYVLTSNNVQEFDGNFHEPKYHFEGDGIGIFGSAIRDTIKFNLLPRN